MGVRCQMAPAWCRCGRGPRGGGKGPLNAGVGATGHRSGGDHDDYAVAEGRPQRGWQEAWIVFERALEPSTWSVRVAKFCRQRPLFTGVCQKRYLSDRKVYVWPGLVASPASAILIRADSECPNRDAHEYRGQAPRGQCAVVSKAIDGELDGEGPGSTLG